MFRKFIHYNVLLVILFSIIWTTYGYTTIHQSCVDKYGSGPFEQIYDGYGAYGKYYITAKVFECDKSNSGLVRLLHRYLGEGDDEVVAVDRLGHFGIETMANRLVTIVIHGIDSLLYTTDEDGDVMALVHFKETPKSIATRNKTALLHHLDKDILVISDIDDTIKYSQISDLHLAAKELLSMEFRPFDTINEKYKLWENTTSFVYLSAGFKQAYELMRHFVFSHFPHGPIILRTIRLKDYFSSEFKNMPYVYKVNRASQVLNITKNKVVLIGDSTEVDAKIYATLYMNKDYRNRICHIYIRIVKQEQLTKVELFLDEVPKQIYTLFVHADELPDQLNCM